MFRAFPHISTGVGVIILSLPTGRAGWVTIALTSGRDNFSNIIRESVVEPKKEYSLF